jgi:lysyl-tRNA synthetase class 2
LTTENEKWPAIASQKSRQLRAEIYRRIRDFFQRNGVMEVETPLLSEAANTDPNIDSFQCLDVDGSACYLRTSAEFPMKRLLASDCGPIYELGRVFRQAEQGDRHNPEFTMLEWYRPGFDHLQLMDEVEALLLELGAIDDTSVIQRCLYRDLVKDRLGIDPIGASDEVLQQFVRQQGWYDSQLSRSACLDLVLSMGVIPMIQPGELLFIHGFPACQSALAAIDPEDNRVAQRFEVFLGPLELANGYNELCDPVELSERFESENQVRKTNGKPPMPVDKRLIAATEQGIRPCAGVALGVDRLLMTLGGEESLQSVINFPWSRA